MKPEPYRVVICRAMIRDGKTIPLSSNFLYTFASPESAKLVIEQWNADLKRNPTTVDEFYCIK